MAGSASDPGGKMIQHNGDTVLESYTVSEGYVRVDIVRSAMNSEINYVANEPKITHQQASEITQLKSMIMTFMPDLAGSIGTSGWKLQSLIQSFMDERMPWIKGETKKKYIYYLNRDFDGYGLIDPLVRDPMIEDISCDGPGTPVYLFHNEYGSIKSNVFFGGASDLGSYIVRLSQMCGKSISVSNPLLDGITRDGHRVEAIYSEEISSRGPVFTIRLFRESPFTPTELIRFGTASPEMMAYLWMMVESMNSALIVGSPGSGKTSTLNSIMMFAPDNTKIFSIEETRELNLVHENWVAAETRELSRESLEGVSSFDLFELVKVAMRQRPTYIVVGEVRGREIYALFQAMATGHTTYSTVHADSMESLMNRLETEPMNVPRLMIAYLNIVIFINFVKIGEKRTRRITEIDEITGIDGRTNDVTYNKVFAYDPLNDSFAFSGNSLLYKKIMEQNGLTFKAVMRDVEDRAELLKSAADSGMSQDELSEILFRYDRGAV